MEGRAEGILQGQRNEKLLIYMHKNKTLNKIGVVKTDVLHIKCKLVMENIITYPKLSLRNTFISSNWRVSN